MLRNFSNLIPKKDNLYVYEVIREHLKKGTTVIEQFREAIDFAKLNFTITTTAKFDEKNFPYNRETIDFLDFLNNEKPYLFFKKINDTIKEIVNSEIEIVKKSNIGEKTDIEQQNQLVTFYEGIIQRIDMNNNKIAFIPIGFAKNYYQNSIGNLIVSEDYRTFVKMRQIYRMGKNNQKFFPITRYVCFADPFIPMGWVKISEENYKEKGLEDQTPDNNNNETTSQTKIAKSITDILTYDLITLQDGDIVTAKAVKVVKPHSEIEILTTEGAIKVKMYGTKKAQQTGTFEKNSIVKVKITLKEGKITQTKFETH